nr:MAG TPA: LemA family [Caudoviricetes sp.]DAS16930.1 MAG TPA: LemA family [Caudoviricetes sp.]
MTENIQKMNKEKMNKNIKIIFIIVWIVLSVIIFNVILFAGTSNKAIVYEEQIKESKSAIKIQEKRRVDLITNLIDTVKSYNNYEQETITKIIDARNKAINGNIKEVKSVINAVAEQYPNLKSNENYKQIMTEMSVTENLIAEYRNNYNYQVKEYTKYIKRFPTNIILSILGYDKKEYSYLDYEVSENAPTNLWK